MPSPITPTPSIYQNPHMAPNGLSGIHLNAYMTDTSDLVGPASAPNQSVQQMRIDPPGIAATIAFNAAHQIVTIHIGSPKTPGGTGAPTITLIDPTTLNTLDKVILPELPPKPASADNKISFAGGYFYLDQESRVVCVVTSQSPKLIQQIQIYTTSNNQLLPYKTYDLSSSIDPSDILNSVLPDSLGNIWYITQHGVVGYVDTAGKIFAAHLNEPISKSFASDSVGRVFIVTDSPSPGVDGALYCYMAGASGPTRSWRTEYHCGTIMKSGQNQIGSGTTPTCFDDTEYNYFVAIADNSPQMNVNVYTRGEGILVAQQAVFTDWPGENSCENSLIAVNHSIIVENNFGNSDIRSTAGDKMTAPGVNRVDFDPTKPLHSNSSVVWANNSIAVPSVVSQLSTGDGMVYTYAKDSFGWYWAALDFDTGKLVTRTSPIKFTDPMPEEASNNYYAGLTVGPDGAAYLSVFGGLVVWRPVTT